MRRHFFRRAPAEGAPKDSYVNNFLKVTLKIPDPKQFLNIWVFDYFIFNNF